MKMLIVDGRHHVGIFEYRSTFILVETVWLSMLCLPEVYRTNALTAHFYFNDKVHLIHLSRLQNIEVGMLCVARSN
jgi:hypothetical protein